MHLAQRQSAHLPRHLAILIVAALAAALLPLAGGIAQADYEITQYPGESGTIVERSGDDLVPSFRYRGVNRFDTAHLIAEDTDTLQAVPNDTLATSDTVLIARADIFPDALAGSYLAGLEEAPLLLVNTTGEIEPHTREALETIDPDDVILLGGTEAISEAVAADLATDYDVRRVRGINRFATAAAIAAEGEDDLPDDAPRVAFVASGEEFPDALVAGALSYAAGLPLLLTGGTALPSETATSLTDLEIDEVLLLGGTGRIAASVQAEIEALDIEVERVFGPTRVGTAAELAALAVERYGFTQEHVNFARGDAFPDALAMGPHAGTEQAVLLLTNDPTRFDDGRGSNATFMGDADCLRSVHLAGGVAAITPETEQAIRTAATQAGEPCLTLTPAEAINLVGEDHTVTATLTDNAGTPIAGTISFTVEADEDSGANPSPDEGSVALDDDGQATFTFTSMEPGDVTITACIEDDGDDSDVCATATKTFNTDAFVDAMTIEALMAHLEAFQDCADEHGGDRETSGPGYECSVDYVRDTLLAAGFSADDIEETFFDFVLWEEEAPGTLAVAGEFAHTTDEEDSPIDYMTYSGSTDGLPVVGELLGVSNNEIPPTAPPGETDAGCDPEDFDDQDFTGTIAVIQRGACDFSVKAINAEAAGAIGVIIFNEGQEGRTDVIAGTLGSDWPDELRDFPVFGASYDFGVELLALEGEEASMSSHTSFEDSSSSNLILTIEGSDSQGAVMHGAHLDSVHDAAGINDNGSGSAGILEVAIQMAEMGIAPRNDTYFAWWGAEEHGLIGSQCYVEGGCGGDLDAGRVVDFTLETPDYTDLGYALLEGGYLNYDMIASPNFMRGIYDGDGDTHGIAGPEGSAQIEATYQAFFDARGLPHQDTDFSGRSDYVGFTNYGIAAGGLFTGAEGVKTEEEQALYGGVAGESYDPCYHDPCDSMYDGWPSGEEPNIHEGVFLENTMAAANSALLFAMSLESLQTAEDASYASAQQSFTRTGTGETYHTSAR